MKAAAALGVLLVLGVLAGTGVAGVPVTGLLPTTTLGSVTTILPKPPAPTVPVPPPVPSPVPLPTTTAPKLPAPPATPTPPLPTAKVTSTATSSAAAATGSASSTLQPRVAGTSAAGAASQLGSTVAPSPSPSASASGSPSAGTPGSGSRAARPGLRSFGASRGFLTLNGPKKKRTVTLTFVLSRAGRVLLVVKQVSPTCKVAGRVSVYGRKGLNRVRFAGRLRGEPLQAGTYTIAIRRPRAPVFKRVTVVIVSQGIPTRLELFASRAANVCTTENARDSRLLSAPGDVSGAQANPAGTVAGAGASPPELRERVRNQSAGVPSGGVLGTSIQEAVRNIRPAVVALLALAIMLLALASLPGVAIPDRRINDALVRHRIEIAGLGAAALVATAVAFLLG